MIERQLIKYFMLIREFGLYTAINELLLRIVGRIVGKNALLWKRLSAHKYRYIDKKLEIEFHDLIKKYSQRGQQVDKISNAAVIWVFWAQGIDAIPSIVKLCVESILKNSDGHPVIFLDNNNLSDYVQLDANILKKYEEGRISTPHFSDVVRFKLLADYGGIWCDSTIFMSKSINSLHLSKYSFFTIKHNIGKDYLACRGLWTTFFVASSKGNALPSFVYECLCRYWSEHESAIDYLFLDSIITIGYENIISITRDINTVPENNKNVFEAMYSFENLEKESNIKEKIDTSIINKLTYKAVRGREQIKLMENVLSSYICCKGEV